jgi:hypothetical protein
MYLRAVQNGEDFDITYPFSIKMLRKIHRNVSFPNVLPNEELAKWDVFPVVPVAKPSGDVVKEVQPVFSNGEWRQTWDVRSFTTDKLDELEANRAERMQNEVSARLKRIARERGYRDIDQACTYASSGNTKWAAEAAACIALRDAMWQKLEEIEADATANNRAKPNRIADIEAELPTISWPG